MACNNFHYIAAVENASVTCWPKYTPLFIFMIPVNETDTQNGGHINKKKIRTF